MALATALTSLPPSLPQSFCSSAVKAPVQVIMLRALAFLACAFLLATALYGTSDPFTPGVTLPPALPPSGNGSATPDNSTATGAEGWRQLLDLLPEHVTEKLREAWALGQSHQTGIAALGLLTCLLAMLLAGRIRCVWDRLGHGSAPGSLWSLLGVDSGGEPLGLEPRGPAGRGAQPWAGSTMSLRQDAPLFPGSWGSSGRGEACDLHRGSSGTQQAHHSALHARASRAKSPRFSTSASPSAVGALVATHLTDRWL